MRKTIYFILFFILGLFLFEYLFSLPEKSIQKYNWKNCEHKPLEILGETFSFTHSLLSIKNDTIFYKNKPTAVIIEKENIGSTYIILKSLSNGDISRYCGK